MRNVLLPEDPELIKQLCDLLAVYLLRENLRASNTVIATDDVLEKELLSMSNVLPLARPLTNYEIASLEEEYLNLERLKSEITKQGEAPNDRDQDTVG